MYLGTSLFAKLGVLWEKVQTAFDIQFGKDCNGKDRDKAKDNDDLLVSIICLTIGAGGVALYHLSLPRLDMRKIFEIFKC